MIIIFSICEFLKDICCDVQEHALRGSQLSTSYILLYQNKQINNREV